MTFKITVLCGLLLCGVLSVDSASECKKCMDKNYAKCLNSTSYQFCMGTGTPIVWTELSGVYNCEAGEVCTDSKNICEPQDFTEATITAPCGGGAGGGVCSATPTCNAGGEFHCTGPSKYVFCTSATSSLPQTCPDGEFCSEDLRKVNKICATESVLTALELEATCGSPTTPAPSTLADKCWAARGSAAGATVFLIEDTNDCKKYIYCEWSGNELVGLSMSCNSGSHFDDTKKKCVTGPCS